MEQQSNVIPMRPQFAIFNKELRQKMESEITGKAPEPSVVVTTLENVICTYLVAIVCRAAAKLATKVGEKIVNG